MSHLTPVKTQIKNLASLIKALGRMGLTPQQGDITLLNDYWEQRGYKSGTIPVQVLVSRDQISVHCNSDIGFEWTGEAYQLHADEMELSKWVYNPNSEGYRGFVQQLHDSYALAQLESQIGRPIKVVGRKVLPDGTIRNTIEYVDQEAFVENAQETVLQVRG